MSTEDYLDFQKNSLKSFAFTQDRPDLVIKKAYFAAPAQGTTTAVLPSTTLADGETTEVTEGIVQPDVPRILTATGNQSSVAGDVVIEGYDWYNTNISETLTLNGTSTISGEKAFKYITRIILPALAAASDAVSIGTGDKLGLKEVVKEGVVLLAFANDTEEATKPTIIKNKSEVSKNLIEFNTALNGSINFTCYFLDK